MGGATGTPRKSTGMAVIAFMPWGNATVILPETPEFSHNLNIFPSPSGFLPNAVTIVPFLDSCMPVAVIGKLPPLPYAIVVNKRVRASSPGVINDFSSWYPSVNHSVILDDQDPSTQAVKFVLHKLLNRLTKT